MERQLPRASKKVTSWYDCQSKFKKFALLKMPSKIEPSDIVRIFSGNLRTFRKARGMSQSDLARAAGLGKAYISDIERQLRNPTIDSVEKLARALGCEAWELLYSKTSNSHQQSKPASDEAELIKTFHSKMFDSDTLGYEQFLRDLSNYIAQKSGK